ncbi:class III lanthionine synthetase LanKC [Actinoplanes flavus]|uniref:Class III lanthionine synthetase LanKC n=1 Tax=Actinoplanes flavus TaxID=2820290 RepID=A0ABS3USA6_9ACTN|nr:class III lanthionine synthetase LanKC [Actinoplanes flavus]MBO3741453.1 class III lanthionine synthetase LanKC [Actinoplanes flavus]
MDVRYDRACDAPGPFFDIPVAPEPSDGYAALAPAPEGWDCRVQGEWRQLTPAGRVLPEQGWKIHVSATSGTAAEVLRVVHGHCVPETVAFKHLVSPAELLRRNGKYAPRAASGKFVTVYPADDDVLAATLDALQARLAGMPGAYVLSDLRIGDGPLYVRYGGFRPMWVTGDGRRVAAIRRPDGILVPDPRTAAFTVPGWVSLPDVLAPHVAARAGGERLPYRVVKALHFSNGGGVYQAYRNTDGSPVVLKEGRPHAGLDARGADAVQRLRHEHRVWSELAGLPGIPEVYELFTAWEHTFMAMRHVPGVHLGRWVAANCPLHADATDTELRAYARRATALADRLAAVIAGMHERGWIFGDLHPRNVLVGEHDEPTLIDAETAFPVTGAEHRPALGAPGFRSPAHLRGAAVDEYALAAIRWWLWLPLVAMDELVPPVSDRQLAWAHRRYGVPRPALEALRRTLRAGPRHYRAAPVDAPTDPGRLRAALVRALSASATPQRADRLFPGDVEQAGSDGLGFGYGACGVLFALRTAGEPVPPRYRQWLDSRLRDTPPQRPGFWTGAHGVAWTLHLLGAPDRAETILSRIPDRDVTGADLAEGRAGAALALLDLGIDRGDRRLTDRAAALARDLDPAGLPPGLFTGAAGVALTFLRLYDVTGETCWLARARQAMEQALAGCVDTGHGLAVLDGGRTLPYLWHGSAGIALVAARLARHLPDTPATERLPHLLRACETAFTIYPGLLAGRAGLLLAQASLTADPALRAAVVDRHLTGLRLHAVGYAGGVAYPGTTLRRLSMDVHTGTAGVLLALAGPHRPALPLLTPLTSLRPAPAGPSQPAPEGAPPCKTFSTCSS